MEAATFDAMKRNRTTLRKQVTGATKSLTTLISSSGSRRTAHAQIVHLDDLILKTSILQTEIKAEEEDDDEADRQKSIHLIYVEKVDEGIAAAQTFLASREGEAAPVINLRNEPIDPPKPNPFLSISSPSDIDRRAHEEEISAAQRKCEEIRERANAIWAEAEAAQENLRLLNLGHNDPNTFTSVSQEQEKFSPAA